MNIKTILSAATACTLMLLASCGENRPTPEPEKIPINVATTIQTKATDNEFEEGDKVGLFVVNHNAAGPATLALTGNHADNALFTFSGSKWIPQTQLYWKDQSTKADFYCYYPYQPTLSSVTALAFELRADQSKEADYKASDFLWGKKAGEKPSENLVRIEVNHLMSSILVYLQPGDGYKAEDLSAAQVFICNTKRQAQIDLTNGNVSSQGTASKITSAKNSDHYRALVVPQTVTEGTKLIEIKLGGDTYSLNLEKDTTFVSGKQVKCTLKVNRTSEGINIGINGWEEGDTISGTVS